MKKTIVSFILVLTLCFTLTVPAFAAQTDVYIDASTVSQDELNAIVSDAAETQEVIVIDWQDGTVVTLSPEIDDEIDPCIGINVSTTYSLTTNSWTYVGTCYTLLVSNLKVTNRSNNPGSINVQIDTGYVLNGVHYYYDIPVGYTAKITVNSESYEIYLCASSVNGSYKVKVSDWII